MAAEAQNSRPLLREVHRALQAGDPSTTDALRLVRRLTHEMPLWVDPAELREGRFLRAMLATRLAVTAALAGDDDGEAALGASLGVQPSWVSEFLLDELDDLGFGIYREATEEAAATLRFARGDTTSPPDTGPMHELWVVDRILERASHRDPIPVLAEEGDDCATTVVSDDADPCAPVFRQIPGATGRRAVAALQRAWDATKRLEAQADRGDPLARALFRLVPERREALRRVSLQVGAVPREPVPTASAGPGNGGQTIRLSALFIVGPDETRFGAFPAVHLNAAGEPELAAGAGILPDTTPLVDDDALGRAMVSAVATSRLPVAITALEGSSAEELRRLLLAVSAAEVDPVFFGGDSAAPVLVSLRIERTEAPFEPTAQYRVRVVQAGFAFRAERGLEAIPRLGGGDRMRYDLARLERRINAGRIESASLSFVPTADAGAVVAAALRLAPAERALTLLIQ
ncbi:MAG: hypothetical protein AAGF12_34480 [Myxococcota bacterium]